MDPTPTAPKPSPGDLQAIERLKTAYDRLKAQMHRVIIGQDRVLDELLTCIFSRGHALIVGVPGLAKTLMIRTLARCLSLEFNRIQFTPDLMPSDITGTEVIYEDKASGERSLRFIRGPIFANIILADEINRTPPKTQAALLEAMQELQVTVGGKRYELSRPFFVLATQNPIEQEGTYPLPEAQLDRFMFNITIDYPSEPEEMEIVKLTTAVFDERVDPILTGADIAQLQEIVRRVPASDHVIRYAMNITRSTRIGGGGAVPQFVRDWVQWGAGPRATQYLIIGAKAHAILKGRYYVTIEDVQAVARPVLRHRIITNFSAEAEGVNPDQITARLLEAIPSKPSELDRAAGAPPVTQTAAS
jgi:MoxR-like ATPase